MTTTPPAPDDASGAYPAGGAEEAPRAMARRDAGTRTSTPAADRRLRWLVRGGTQLLRTLARTWRVSLVAREPVDECRAAREPIVFSFWHGDLLPLLWVHRDEGVHVLISEHRDGEAIARVSEAHGFRTLRGSTTRGAGRALLGLVRVLRDGGDVAITPDGPRGPARTFAPGALIAAQRADAPIVAVGVHVDRSWRLRSWDRFQIPKPFARITVAYAPPTRVAATTVREAAGEGMRFQALHELAANAAAESAAAAAAAPGRQPRGASRG